MRTRPRGTKTMANSVRMTPEEHRMLVNIALHRNISMSQLMIDSTLASATHLEYANPPTATTDSATAIQ